MTCEMRQRRVKGSKEMMTGLWYFPCEVSLHNIQITSSPGKMNLTYNWGILWLWKQIWSLFLSIIPSSKILFYKILQIIFISGAIRKEFPDRHKISKIWNYKFILASEWLFYTPPFLLPSSQAPIPSSSLLGH